MRHILFAAVLLLGAFLAPSLLAQDFQPGYLIMSSGQQESVLIESLSGSETPEKIRWRKSYDGRIVTSQAADLKGFGWNKGDTYVVAEVKLDRSSMDPDTPSRKFAPEWEEAKTFLKVLLGEGVGLYEWRKGDRSLFFLRRSLLDKEIIPLVYKPYLNEAGQLDYNDSFRQQLAYLEGSGECFSEKDFQKLSYTAVSLTKHIQVYQTCQVEGMGIDMTDYTFLMKVWGQAGVGRTSFSQRLGDIGTDVGGEVSGLIEFIPAGAKGYLSLFADIAVRYVSIDSATYAFSQVSSNPATLDYLALDFVAGPRLYVPVGRNSRVFAETGFVLEGPLRSSLDVIRQTTTTFKLAARPSFIAGLGFQWKRFSLQGRYYLPREVLKETSGLTSRMNLISVRLGFQIVQKKLY